MNRFEPWDWCRAWLSHIWLNLEQTHLELTCLFCYGLAWLQQDNHRFVIQGAYMYYTYAQDKLMYSCCKVTMRKLARLGSLHNIWLFSYYSGWRSRYLHIWFFWESLSMTWRLLFSVSLRGLFGSLSYSSHEDASHNAVGPAHPGHLSDLI